MCSVPQAPRKGARHERVPLGAAVRLVLDRERSVAGGPGRVSFHIPTRNPGLVGESGSGKTTLALASIGYLPANGRVTGGSAWLGDSDLLSLSRRELRSTWGSRVGLVSQSPVGAFNPSLTIGRQLDEMGRRHLGLGRRAARDRTLTMLNRVEMPDPRSVVSRYPHQLSGGMLQRSAIAMALMTNPELLILDEPTTALDVTTQATILDLLAELKSEFSSALLYITHNLGVVSHVCDRIGVMYAGRCSKKRERRPFLTSLCTPIPSISSTAPRASTRPDLRPAGEHRGLAP